jgi:L-asparaginase
VNYIQSRIWADGEGRNRLGIVAIQDRQFFAAREVTKVDARAGGYIASGGHGGILGQFTHANVISLMYLPAYKHTHLSQVNVTRLPERVAAVRLGVGGLERFDLALKDKNGRLLENAIPSVAIVKDGTYCGEDFGDDPAPEEDLDYLVKHKLRTGRLVGFIAEGITPYGKLPSEVRNAILERAIFSGVPVVRVGRGNPEGFSDLDPIFISGSNLNAIKAPPATDGCLDETGQPAKCFGPGTAHCCRDRRDAKGSGHLPTDIQHTLKNEIGSRTKFRRNLGQR